MDVIYLWWIAALILITAEIVLPGMLNIVRMRVGSPQVWVSIQGRV